MTDKVRTTIAALLTALFIAGVSTAGLLAHAGKSAPVAASAVPTVVAAPQPGAVARVTPDGEDREAHDCLRTRIWRTSSGYAHHLIDPATGEPAWTG